MESASYAHIPREWNRAADSLVKWASKNVDGEKIDEWEHMLRELGWELERILEENVSGGRES